MFSGWLNVRLKAAQRALDDGRLDDALAAATAPDVRGQRSWQSLSEELATQLVARARLHIQAGRYREALSDLAKVGGLGGNTVEIQTLEQKARGLLTDERQDAATKEAAIQRAAADLRDGRLDSGRVAVARIADADQRGKFEAELEFRQTRLFEVLEQAGAALQRGETLVAIRVWQDGCRRHGQTRETDDFARRCAASLHGQVGRWLDDGDLSRALSARDSLAGLRAHDPALGEHEQVLRLCAQAGRELHQRDYLALRQSLLRLRGIRESMKWVAGPLDAVGKAVDHLDALLASPLAGCASAGDEPAETLAPAPVRMDIRAMAPPPAASSGSGILLLIDGAGSALLTPRRLVRIGRLGANVEVPFPTELQSHHADIERDGEDYFLTAYGTAFVNQRRVTRTLLRDGDRILLGGRAKMVFSKPSAKSPSAVLRLSHSSRLPQDVSNVILFRETCLIGPQPSCHIRTREGETQIVVFERDGELMLRHAATAARKLGDAEKLAIGRTYELGEVRLTAQDYGPGNRSA